MSAAGGELAGNIAVFVRVLRAAGLRLGPRDTVSATRAAATVGLGRRDDLFWALHAVLVSDPRDRDVFAQAFGLVFREPATAEAALFSAMSALDAVSEARTSDVSRRVAEAVARLRPQTSGPDPASRAERDAAMTWSDREALRHRDFEDMSAAELAAARAAIATMDLGVRPAPTRRYAPDPRGVQLDTRAVFRAAARAGEPTPRWRARRRRPPPVVLLCDISGSMQRYSRMLLVLAHALTGARARVSSFVFGTRLTHVTRQLRNRDADAALSACGAAVPDWGGGTRIGGCLTEFNKLWSRRVLGRGAVVLLVTDGLERGDEPAVEALESAMARLHRSCRRLIWLNPLLRYAGFEPRARGVRAILPHVDEHRPVHSLASLDQLAVALRRPGVRDPHISGGRTGARTSL